MPTATSCRNRRRRPACASCARRELRRVRYASWSDCSECKARLATTVIYVYNTYMTKKLTITVSDEVYEGLHRRVGRRKISRFINELARERLQPGTLAQEYA